MKRKWERLSEDEKEKAKEALIYFFEKERDQQIGLIAAEEILNFFLEQVGPKLYNKGLQDAKTAVQNRMEELDYDISALYDLDE